MFSAGKGAYTTWWALPQSKSCQIPKSTSIYKSHSWKGESLKKFRLNILSERAYEYFLPNRGQTERKLLICVKIELWQPMVFTSNWACRKWTQEVSLVGCRVKCCMSILSIWPQGLHNCRLKWPYSILIALPTRVLLHPLKIYKLRMIQQLAHWSTILLPIFLPAKIVMVLPILARGLNLWNVTWSHLEKP